MLQRIKNYLIRRAERTPYFHLKGYMERYWLLGGTARDPRPVIQRAWVGSILDRWVGRLVCVRIHRILSSDHDRHLHDHPCSSASLILEGGYWEIFPKRQDQHPSEDAVHYRRVWRGPGTVVVRRAGTRHRLELEPGVTPVSLFVFGPRTQKWGFYTESGKVYWREYLGLDPAAESAP
ncbi:conserved hypothetical protein (plasmid) [Thioalkalivibrio sp. K90mix]|uniref:hypothetical protein n=1 Tax=Thioalkalivibrio sp. (strain K90mix) TaxID=396595 RepID=UPI000195A3C7|nr:hypothetical protein [Thioalkalivibrio sp. K90mix]ADC73169.1 conserved hypothetical protein [Thioalkalivibrio sp. K90mix]